MKGSKLPDQRVLGQVRILEFIHEHMAEALGIFVRPRALAGWIVRSRLLERLDRVLQEPVALISAPAGFGKTTLISQWLDRCPLPSAWLQLDEDDHEIPAFLAGVVAALRQLFPDCLRKTADLLLSSGSIPLAVWKSTLIDDLALLEDTPCVLALDDYHLVGNPLIDLLLADVLRSESISVHLIISARRSPSLSFSKLRVQRRIVEIPTADLRFTDSETALYFDQAAHLPLSNSAIQKLLLKTEGWAAGLALAALSLREENQPGELCCLRNPSTISKRPFPDKGSGRQGAHCSRSA